jgi:hypothetical protein
VPTILGVDDPERHEALLPAFRDPLADLGINGAADIPRRADRTLRYLPRLWQATVTIMAANPGPTQGSRIDIAPIPLVERRLPAGRRPRRPG